MKSTHVLTHTKLEHPRQECTCEKCEYEGLDQNNYTNHKRATKYPVEGRRPTQELKEGLLSRPYILVFSEIQIWATKSFGTKVLQVVS